MTPEPQTDDALAAAWREAVAKGGHVTILPPDRTCSTCRFWADDGDGQRGECSAFRAAYVHPAAVVYGDFMTRPTFGCNQHEPTPEENP